MVIPDAYGRLQLKRVSDKQGVRFVRVLYTSRAMEWLNLRNAFIQVLSHFELSEQLSLDFIALSWTYRKNLSIELYQPSKVFKHFVFAELLDESLTCVCMSASRLKPFLDPLTMLEHSDFCKSTCHVRTMNLEIVQHPKLRTALQSGLNHIILRPTDFREAIDSAVNAFQQLFTILNMESFHVSYDDAVAFFRSHCLQALQNAARVNKFGFRFTGPYLFDIHAVKNEMQWLCSHFYISGLDKANNNACFLCIKHIRLQAYQRLMGEDFTPCVSSLSGTWLLPSAVLDSVRDELSIILPESPPVYSELPFLMAVFKQHKLKYRWLTNAHNTIYSNVASLLTSLTMVILESFKGWARKRTSSYRSFLGCDTSIFWIVYSILQVVLNFPSHLHDIYVADVTRCYESIPLQGQDNLLDAVKFVVNIGFKEASSLHPKALNRLWVRINPDGSPRIARWATSQPHSDGWISFTQERIIGLHQWLIDHCFVVLGDRVWHQIRGIPMGFACSPLWCNIYLLSYETRFVQRLARLGRKDLMSKFQFAYRYIDDLCWLNVKNPQVFLDPLQPRSDNNPFWVYPLHILDIKPEVSRFDPELPTRGLSAHFMNLSVEVNVNDSSKFTLCKYDKRRTLPFKYTQFIKFHSNRPVRQSYNIILSQVLPILYTSNTHAAALEEIEALIRTLRTNGFQDRRLRSSVIHWLRSGTFPLTKVDTQGIAAALAILL